MVDEQAGRGAARHGGKRGDLQVVGLRIGDEEYALGILDIVGIERLENVLQLPRMPSFIEGVMRIRGEVVPLVRLRSRFGFGERENDDQTRVIVVSIRPEGQTAQTVGCIVDSVTAVYRIAQDAVEAAPAMALTVDSRFVKGVIDMDERMLILLNPHEILFGDESTKLRRAATVAKHYTGDEAGEQP